MRTTLYLAALILWCIATSHTWAQPASEHSVKIDKGNKYARSYSVKLSLASATAYQMMVSNNKEFTGGHWAPFQEEINWEMEPKDGLQTVYVKLRDKDNNQLATIKDDIEVDATAPVNCSVAIDVPGKITSDKLFLVDLKLQADEAKYIMVSNSGSFYGEKWRMFQEVIEDWQLDKGDDGYRYVYVKFRDVAGNVSEIFSDKIMIDTRPPYACDIIIDHDNKFSSRQDRQVQLELFSRDADSVRISNTEDFADVAWQPVTSQTDWTLPNEDGPKKVFVQFKDRAGNLGKVVSDDIITDIESPQNCQVTIDRGAEKTADINKIVSLQFSADDATFMLVSNFPDFKGARWQVYSESISTWRLYGEEDGKKTIYVKFKDEAGNISTIFTDEIELVRGF